MSIKCTWNPITTRTSGRPIAPSEVARYELEMRVEGAPAFVNVSSSLALEETVDVSDPGLYEFRVRGVDDAGRPGTYATGSIVIPDTTGLSAPSNFVVSLV